MRYHVPLDVLLSWPTPNYDNPPTSDSTRLYVISGIFLFGASVCVALRLWARIFVRRYLGLDDLFIVLAFVCSIAFTGTVTVGETKYGWNRHIWDMKPANYEVSGKLFYGIRLIWATAASFVRFSVLCLYYRLIQVLPAPRHYLWILHAVTAFNVALFLVYMLVGSFPCIPVRAYWSITENSASCLNDSSVVKSSGVLNTFAELLVAVLPILAVFRLRVDKPWAVIGLMSLGLFVVITGCFRTFYIFKSLDLYDPTWWSNAQWICAEVENNLALMCACAVPLRPVVGRMVCSSNSTTQLQQDSAPSAPSRISKETTSEPHHEFEFNQIHLRADAEEVTEWSGIVQNVVDLEGIVNNDGLGYTVNISGPTRAKGSREWFRSARANIVPTRQRPRPSMAMSDVTVGLEIPMKTEVTVDEIYRSGSESTDPTMLGTARISPTNEVDIDAEIGAMLPQYLGDPSMMVAAPIGESPLACSGDEISPVPSAQQHAQEVPPK